MPSLSMYTVEGELTRWLIDEGMLVVEGQQILELTTEKTTVEIEAPAAGILHQVASEGEQVKVEGLLGYILALGEVLPAAPPATPVAASVPDSLAVAPASTSSGALASGVRLRVSPMARRRAEELGLDLNGVTGTGPGGRITEADIEKAAASGRSVLKRIPLTGIRKMIAARMQQSLSNTAQLTLTREVDAGPLIQARKKVEAAAKADKVKVPFDVLLAKGLALALLEKPDLNAIIENNQIVVLEEINVGIAVATGDCLIVPVLRNVDRRAVLELCQDFASIIERARQGKLQPEEYEGGTVTITNLGLYNIDAFTPILNPPESAILGVGRIAPRPFVTEEGELTTRQTVHLSLTFDHRVVDGVTAALLLNDMVAQWPNLG